MRVSVSECVGEEEEVGGRRTRVCLCVWAGGGGWEGFPLSHKADGPDVSGCSQSQPGPGLSSSPPSKSRDSSPFRSPLRILLLTSPSPASGLNCEHLYVYSAAGTAPGHISWQSLAR